MENYNDVWEEKNPPGYDYFCGAFDEEENGVYCDRCVILLHCDIFGNYVCDECGIKYTRQEFFNMIGANHRPLCLKCVENYPRCKQDCEVYTW